MATMSKPEAPVVDAFATLANLGKVWRVFHHAIGEIEREDADGDIEKEDPAPAVVVDDPSADRWAKNRRHDHGHAVNGEGHAALLRGEGVGEDGLLAGLQAAARRALQARGRRPVSPGWALCRTETRPA